MLPAAARAGALTAPRARRAPGRSFCRKLVAATVFSYIAWLAMVPSLYINIVENEDGPW